MCNIETKIDENLYKFNQESLRSFKTGNPEHTYTCFQCTMQHANALKEESFFCDYCKYHLIVPEGVFKQGDKFLCSVCCGCDPCKKWHLTNSNRAQCVAVTADEVKHKKRFPEGSSGSSSVTAKAVGGDVQKRVHKGDGGSASSAVTKAVGGGAQKRVDKGGGSATAEAMGAAGANKKRVHKGGGSATAEAAGAAEPNKKRVHKGGGSATAEAVSGDAQKRVDGGFQFAFRIDDVPMGNQGTSRAVIIAARNSHTHTGVTCGLCGGADDKACGCGKAARK